MVKVCDQLFNGSMISYMHVLDVVAERGGVKEYIG